MTIGLAAWCAFVVLVFATLAYAIRHDDTWGG